MSCLMETQLFDKKSLGGITKKRKRFDKDGIFLYYWKQKLFYSPFEDDGEAEEDVRDVLCNIYNNLPLRQTACYSLHVPVKPHHREQNGDLSTNTHTHTSSTKCSGFRVMNSSHKNLNASLCDSMHNRSFYGDFRRETLCIGNAVSHKCVLAFLTKVDPSEWML